MSSPAAASTSEQPVKSSGSPSEPSKRNILMAVDETDASQRASDWIVEHMLRPGDEVHFLHVVAPAEAEIIGDCSGSGWEGIGPPVMSTPDPELERQRVKEAAAHIFEHHVPKMKGAPCKVEIGKTQTSAENVGEVLCERAEDLNAAALVMACHNKGVMQRFFLGSASYYCMQHCTRPLVIVH